MMKRVVFFFLSLIGLITALYFAFPYLPTGRLELALFIAIIALAMITSFSLVLWIFAKNHKRIKSLENRLAAWNNVSYHVKRAGDEAFNELPVGILIYDETLEIKWGNKYAKTLFQSKLIELKLQSVHLELFRFIEEGHETMTIQVFDKMYDVISRKEHRLLYFFDVTQREAITLKYKNRTTAIGIIYLDNMEESLSNFDVQEKSNIRGQYLGVVSDWVSDFGGYLKPYADDRLVMVMDYSQLTQMMEQKFDILNAVRAISTKHQLRVTVSIGIASYDIEYEELGGYAQNAIELAEKRGGDQVVVNIQGEKMKYFGGKTNAQEKSSRVQVRVMAHTLRDLLEHAESVYVMGHASADIDALGAMIAGFKMASIVNKQVYVVADDSAFDLTVTKVIPLLKEESSPFIKAFISPKEAQKRMDEKSVLLVLDSQSPLLVFDKALLSQAKQVAIIDHHRPGDESFQAVYQYVEPYASSSVELVVEMLSFFSKDIEVTPLEATLMLGGILVDTNDFTYRTSSRTFEVAGMLKDMGADTIRIRTLLREDLARNIEISQWVARAEVELDRFAIVKCDDQLNVSDRVILAQVSEQLLKIENIDAAFTIGRIDEETIGISARSFNQMNVQIIMEELGGGGHLNSAAAQMKNTSTDEVMVKLIDILKRESEEGGELMKIILTEDVKGKGNKGDIIDVATGYGNFILTNKKGVLATPENVKALEEAKAKEKQDALNHLNLMNKLKKEIESHHVTMHIKPGQDGKLFGSVTNKMVVEEFEKQTGIRLDKKKVELTSEINSIGIYTATVQLHRDVTAQIEINVIEK